MLRTIGLLLVKLSRLVAQSHITFSMRMVEFFIKSVSIVVYAHFSLSDKKVFPT